MSPEDYRSLDATALAELVRRGETTPQELYTRAQELRERVEPALNAISVDLSDYAEQTLERGVTGPFAGVPFLLKDLGGDIEGTIETAGTRLLQNARSTFTRTAVQRWLDAGVVIFGKTHSPEFGITAQTETELHGVSRNPWDLSRSPAGSSGGAAAMVASGVVPVAHASDGGGSIRMPAAVCGLIGLKPTRGRVPVGPEVGEAWAGFSGSHVLTRSVRDSARFLDVAKGHEPVAASSPPLGTAPFADVVDTPPEKPLRILVSEFAAHLTRTHPDIRAGLDRVADELAAMGHHVERGDPAFSPEACTETLWRIVSVNLRASVSVIAERLGLDALKPEHVEPATWACLEQSRDVRAEDYIKMLWQRDQITRDWSSTFNTWDLVLSPVMPAPALPVGALNWTGDWQSYIDKLLRAMPYTPICNVSGTPALSLPAGFTDEGLPAAVHIAAPYGHEARLLSVAGAIERSRGGLVSLAPLPAT